MVYHVEAMLFINVMQSRDGEKVFQLFEKKRTIINEFDFLRASRAPRASRALRVLYAPTRPRASRAHAPYTRPRALYAPTRLARQNEKTRPRAQHAPLYENHAPYARPRKKHEGA